MMAPPPKMRMIKQEPLDHQRDDRGLVRIEGSDAGWTDDSNGC